MQFCVHLKGKDISIKALRGQLTALAFTNKALGIEETTGNFHIRKKLGGGGPRKQESIGMISIPSCPQF